MARRRGDQAVEQIGVLDHIAAAERLDDALDVASPLARVLHEVKVFVGSDLLDADEHGAIPDWQQATTSNRRRSSPIRWFCHIRPGWFSTTIRRAHREPAEFRGLPIAESETV